MADNNPNREQIEYWNGPRGEVWVTEQELKDRELAVFGNAALRQAAAAGESVVDIGCGCGDSTLALARAVGPAGSVLGVDVSAPMLARAKERAGGLSQVQLVCADAARFPFERRATLLFSRFGVMFFVEPLVAFANLSRALVPGGRLVFVCWRGLEENAWLSVPFAAASAVVQATRPTLPPDAPGPMAFANPNRVRHILEGSGFDQVVLHPLDHQLPLGGGQGLEAAAAEALTMGPTARLVSDADPPARARAQAAIREALVPYTIGDQVQLGAAVWVVSATVRQVVVPSEAEGPPFARGDMRS